MRLALLLDDGDGVRAPAILELRAATPRERRVPPDFALTPRERDVIAALVDGGTNRDIATRLRVREQTVKNHLSHIFDKLGVSTRLEAAVHALHHQVLVPPAPIAPPRLTAGSEV